MKSPICQNLEQLLYTTSRPDETSHNCVIVIDKRSALTFGAHQNLTENQVVTIYNVLDSSLQFECVVGKRLDSCDLVCLKLIEGEFPVVPKLDGSISEGQEYMMVGLDAERCPTWRDGVVCERKEETYYTGTSEGDFPGAGIFDKSGRYLGIVIGKDLAESADNRIRIIGQEDSLAICDHMKSAKKYVHSPDWEYCESPPSYGQYSPDYSYGSPSYRQASPDYSHGSPSYGQAASPAYSYGSPSYGQYSPDYSHGSPSYTQYFSVNGQYYSYT